MKIPANYEMAFFYRSANWEMAFCVVLQALQCIFFYWIEIEDLHDDALYFLQQWILEDDDLVIMAAAQFILNVSAFLLFDDVPVVLLAFVRLSPALQSRNFSQENLAIDLCIEVFVWAAK